MSLTLDYIKPAHPNISSIERAMLETLAYSDVFDYPLTVDELHRFLTGAASLREVSERVNSCPNIESRYGFYFLKNRQEIVSIRLQREKISRPIFFRAIRFGRILGSLPFIRMVALTGSLALLNLSTNPDMDFMIAAKPGRVWLARAFALALNRFTRLFGDTLCPNLIVSEKALKWKSQNLYSAREFCQMVLISGREVYLDLRIANLWVNDYLPNCAEEINCVDAPKATRPIQSILEWPLSGKIGDRLEAWEMNRKINRFSKQAGFGAETQFNADICQGNFDHHGSRTLDLYHSRLRELGLDS